MLTLIIITSVFILIYFLYPVWLGLLNDNICAETSDRDINNISVIYLSQNGGNLLYQKLQCILNEMSAFENYEFIVIDDNSNDNSLEILKQFTNYNLNIIHNNETKGIPDSMNTGIKVAKYNNINIKILKSDLFKGIKGRFDWVIFNPPFRNRKDSNGYRIVERLLKDAPENTRLMIVVNAFYANQKRIEETIKNNDYAIKDTITKFLNPSKVYIVEKQA